MANLKVCAMVCVRACARACVRACARACVLEREREREREREIHVERQTDRERERQRERAWIVLSRRMDNVFVSSFDLGGYLFYCGTFFSFRSSYHPIIFLQKWINITVTHKIYI